MFRVYEPETMEIPVKPMVWRLHFRGAVGLIGTSMVLRS